MISVYQPIKHRSPRTHKFTVKSWIPSNTCIFTHWDYYHWICDNTYCFARFQLFPNN